MHEDDRENRGYKERKKRAREGNGCFFAETVRQIESSAGDEKCADETDEEGILSMNDLRNDENSENEDADEEPKDGLQPHSSSKEECEEKKHACEEVQRRK